MSKSTWIRTLYSNFYSITDFHSFQGDVHEKWNSLFSELVRNKNSKHLFYH